MSTFRVLDHEIDTSIFPRSFFFGHLVKLYTQNLKGCVWKGYSPFLSSIWLKHIGRHFSEIPLNENVNSHFMFILFL